MRNHMINGFTIAAASTLLILITACSADSKKPAPPAANDARASKKLPVTIKVYASADLSSKAGDKQIDDMFTAKTGIKVEKEIVPGDDMYKKIDLDLAAAGNVDVIPLTNPLPLDKYVKNGFLLPLNDFMNAEQYDADRIFGKYVTKYENKIYSLPMTVSVWAVFYNKKIFDDAGVPYPPAEWTWSQYIETAKKLTDPAKGIYGSYMLDYDTYLFMLAKQHNVSAYKADGSSNYDDPIFKESLKFFGDLGNVYKIQPGWSEFKSKNLQWDGFMTGKYGMHLIGNWYTSLLTNTADYPVSWKWGVTQIPTDGAGMNNFGVTFTNAVNKYSTHPKEAWEYVKFRAENSARMSGTIPAFADPSASRDALKQIADASNGSVTVDDLSRAFFDNNLGYVQEKNLGPAAAEYSDIILQEGGQYLMGKRSLDDTIRVIKERADAAIQKVEAAK